MKLITVKIPESLEARLRAAARHSRSSRSDLVRRALEVYVARTDIAAEGSVLAAASDLVGTLEGRGDLSHNKARMRGYGR